MGGKIKYGRVPPKSGYTWISAVVRGRSSRVIADVGSGASTTLSAPGRRQHVTCILAYVIVTNFPFLSMLIYTICPCPFPIAITQYVATITHSNVTSPRQKCCR